MSPHVGCRRWVLLVAAAGLVGCASEGPSQGVPVEVDGTTRHYYGSESEEETRRWCENMRIMDVRCSTALAHEVRELKQANQALAATSFLLVYQF